MNRLYVAESTPTVTGAMADHRLLRVKPSRNRRGIARGNALAAATEPRRCCLAMNLASHDLAANHGASLVIAGEPTA